MSVTIQPIIRLLAGIAMLTLFSACTEELQPDAGNASDRNRTITFGLSSETETKADSRSGHAAGHYVLRSDTSADSLCLAATVADGVYTDNAIITRGTPVGGTNFYDSFRVRGYVDNGTGEADFMDEQLERNGALSDSWKYASDNIYFWPGAGSTFHFYAYAPASLPYADKKIAGYTVPSSATEQQDLMVAATGSLPGDYYRTIGLTFRHICTAVHFSLGYDIRPGTIKSITLKNIRNQGSFDLNASQWTLAETTTDFTLTPNKSTDDTSLPGDAICTPDNTLMMLPQALGDDAQIEVVFQESQNGQEQTLSAPLTGLWTMGIPVRYNISISPDMDLDLDLIVDVSGNTVDAHYVSFPVHIEAAEGVTGTWTLTSDLPDHVTFTDTLTAFQQDNYWVEEDKGTPVFTGTGSKSPVYVYLTENAADTARDIHLTLTGPDGKTITRTVRQLCPAWNGNMGCEQIEEIGETIDGVTKELFPWGFNPEEYTETYTDSKDAFGQNKKYREEIQNTFTELLAGIDYIEIPPNTDKGPVVTINYANAGAAVGMSRDDGLANTKELFTYNGTDFDNLTNLLDVFIADGIFVKETTGESTNIDVKNFAAKVAVKKNRATKSVRTVTINKRTYNIETLKIKEEDFNWYLPAINECGVYSVMHLEGNYWTSTSASETVSIGNANAYDIDGTVWPRSEWLKVCAVRRR